MNVLMLGLGLHEDRFVRELIHEAGTRSGSDIRVVEDLSLPSLERCDLVVLSPDSPFSRYATELGRRKGLSLKVVPFVADGEPQALNLSFASTADDLLRLIRRADRSLDGTLVEQLWDIVRLQLGGTYVLSGGRHSFYLDFDAGRFCVCSDTLPSASELRALLLEGGTLLVARHKPQAEQINWRSLGGLLWQAGLAHPRLLKGLDSEGAYSLSSWPLQPLRSGTLQLASLLRRGYLSVDQMVRHVGLARADIYGLLNACALSGKLQQRSADAASQISGLRRGFFQRLRNTLGLSL
ncbi:hypothetical protein [Metapseudomonas otitidis]|uniref:hypothetical protein n=1 Tax=Metapseudomonas otitidis TaxID=319939 RepID=UPI0013F5DEF1|nr:hypothetical protein [Pseudomonas otitidis]